MLAALRTTRHLTALAITGALVSGLAACEQVDEIVQEAQTQVSEAAQTVEFCSAAVQLADAVDNQNVDAAVTAGETFVDKAPDEIRPDAELVLAAAREAQAGDPAALQSQEVADAGQRLRQFTVDECNPASNDS